MLYPDVILVNFMTSITKEDIMLSNDNLAFLNLLKGKDVGVSSSTERNLCVQYSMCEYHSFLFSGVDRNLP